MIAARLTPTLADTRGQRRRRDRHSMAPLPCAAVLPTHHFHASSRHIARRLSRPKRHGACTSPAVESPQHAALDPRRIRQRILHDDRPGVPSNHARRTHPPPSRSPAHGATGSKVLRRPSGSAALATARLEQHQLLGLLASARRGLRRTLASLHSDCIPDDSTHAIEFSEITIEHNRVVALFVVL